MKSMCGLFHRDGCARYFFEDFNCIKKPQSEQVGKVLIHRIRFRKAEGISWLLRLLIALETLTRKTNLFSPCKSKAFCILYRQRNIEFALNKFLLDKILIQKPTEHLLTVFIPLSWRYWNIDVKASEEGLLRSWSQETSFNSLRLRTG